MAERTPRIAFGDDAIEHTRSAEDHIESLTYKKMASTHEVDADSLVSDRGVGVREGDMKKRQVFKGWTLLWLVYQSTGVIYGDIGTSPLYVFSSTFSSPPAHADLLGALSIILWSLTLIVTVKYMLIVLYADDNGEGGTFAMYNLLARFSNIIKQDPSANHLMKMERYSTNDLKRPNRGFRRWLENSKISHAFLKILAVLGVSLIMADGILTPAQSVLGAIQGLEVAVPNISKGTIIGTTCGILILLFLVQPFGIHRVSSVFAPVVIIWLLFNGVSGIYNLAVHDYTVLKAFSPYYAGDWFVRNGTAGWINLGGLLLAFTGVEALFADLGAFSRRAIQLSWLCIAYPCLMLAYIGQASYLAKYPAAYDNPFFKTVPPGTFYFALVIAILAAVVASQALITSTFQLLSQVMNSSYFPHIKMIYTSDKFHGQVYIPIANWLMMVGTVIVTAVYNNTNSLGHAYGVCVILVTFITTNLVTLVAIIVWRFHPALVFTIWLPFVLLDGLYLSSALTKVPNGAWFTLLLSFILASFFTLWRYGKEKQWACEKKDRQSLSQVIVSSADNDGQLMLSDQYGGGKLTTIEGFGIFFDKAGESTPMVYEQWLRKFRAQMDTVVLLHLRALSIPHVAEEDRFAVARTGVRNVYRVVVRHGYSDRVITPDLAQMIYEEIRRAIIHDSVQAPSESGNGAKEAKAVASIAARLQHLDDAFRHQVLYMTGKEQMRISGRYNAFKRMVLGVFLWVRENCRTRIASLDIPVDRIVEVGFVHDL
ncbi:putative potassium transporter 5 [Neohortaea acidophila]|uniref:Putative potassium transporter 5 n=1 Tax=Neohortaea acidophila TaxID=245834 RepID=A0A6A6PTI6_9PEZI|nr:putative potassium transporter 5 [Neohortaea acidophila]KAF2482537.1 putative potassium transporter 5 [Neohortaea acidophila]